MNSSQSAAERGVAFELPWPWGGELFRLNDIRPLNYIVGPLGSGKTKLALRLAETLANAVFLGLERLSNDGSEARTHLDADPILKSRVDQVLSLLIAEGGKVSGALVALLDGLESDEPNAFVVDMIEEELDETTQEVLITYLRQRSNSDGRPIFFSTRSSAILDLNSVGPNETIILCPANHTPPTCNYRDTISRSFRSRSRNFPVPASRAQSPAGWRRWHSAHRGRGDQ